MRQSGPRLEIKLGNAKGPGMGRAISITMADYGAVDHCYTTAIHKARRWTGLGAGLRLCGSAPELYWHDAPPRVRDALGWALRPRTWRCCPRASPTQLKRAILECAHQRALDREDGGARAAPIEFEAAREAPAPRRSMFDRLECTCLHPRPEIGRMEGLQTPGQRHMRRSTWAGGHWSGLLIGWQALGRSGANGWPLIRC